MQQILYVIGLSQMSTTNLSYLALAILIGCVFAGWFSDSLLRSAGFGVIINSLLMFVWLFVGLAVYSVYVRQIRTEDPLITVFVATGSAVFGLIFTAFMKNAFSNEK